MTDTRPEKNSGNDSHGWTPRPDPTRLTTQQLLREITALERLVFTRLDAMDKALALSHESLTRVPTEVDKQIEHLSQLVNEKFAGISQRFIERDSAVTAALNAQREVLSEQSKSASLAIAKSESATAKQIDTQGVLIHTTTKALEGAIVDLKERMTRIESEDRGERTGKTTQSASVGVALSIIGSAIGVAGFLAFLLRP